MRKKLSIGFFLLVLIAAVVLLHKDTRVPKTGVMDKTTSIVGLSDQALGPFAWRELDFSHVSEEMFATALKKTDPLFVFQYAFALMRFEARTGNLEAGAMARKLLDHMIREYEPATRSAKGIQWKYGFAYGNLASGWWSGMDALFGPLVLYAAYQQYGNKEYREEAVKSAKLALRPPAEGGVIWKDDEGCWVSEYTWPGMSWEEEYQVLNGHLYGLQALYMLAVLEDDSELMSAYECGYAKSMSAQNLFYANDGKWSWYSLLPKDVNPVHYLIFESGQYNALYMLTGDAKWRTGYETRVGIFENAYTPEIVTAPNGETKVLLSMLGAPHPYWPDTYPLRLSCKVGEKAYSAYNRKYYWSHLPLKERFFVELNIPSKPDSCVVDADVFPSSFYRLYETNAFAVAGDGKGKNLGLKADAILNASLLADAHSIQVDHTLENMEGRVSLNLERELDIRDVVALVVDSDLDTYIGFLMTDEDGNVASREYNPIVAGKPNLILLNRYGFNGQEALGKNIKSLTLRLYADEKKSKFNFRIKNMQVLSGANELRQYLSAVGDVEFRVQ